MDRGFTLSDNSVVISGEHYTISNGFATKAHGEIRIRYNDFLAVEVVRHRSKRVLYAMLIPACIFMFLLSFDDILLIVILAVVLAIVTSIIGATYFFSVRYFVEFTTMKGTYRIDKRPGDTEIEGIVAQLQVYISNNK